MDDQGSMPRKSFVQQPQIGVPRKFAVGSLLAITAVYCILFRILTVYDATWAGLILFPFFVTFVGIAQAVFFGGQHPREASMLAGAISGFVLTVAGFVSVFSRVVPNWSIAIASVLYATMIGMLLGYLTGLFLAGIFYAVHGRPKNSLPNDREIQSRMVAHRGFDRFLLRCLAVTTLPFRPGRALAELLGMAVWCTLLLVPVALGIVDLDFDGYLNIRLELRAGFIAAGFAVLGAMIWAGVRAIARRTTCFLVILGLIGGLLVGWLSRNVTIIPGMVFTGELKMFLGAAFGMLLGLFVAGLTGWLSWLLTQLNFGHRVRKLIPAVATVGLACLLLVSSTFLIRTANGPREKVLRSLPPSSNVSASYPPWIDHIALGKTGTDGLLAELHVFKHLVQCDLRWSKVTDPGLLHLKNCQSVIHLNLSDTQISNDGIANINGRLNLSSLSIERTNVTDAGFVHLANQTNLRYLFMNGCNVTGNEITRLQALTKLAWLGLSDTQVDNNGLAAVATLVGLEHLSLARTRITSPGLSRLTNLKKLGVLDLSGTQIDDQGLVALAQLTSLKRLDLSETLVTPMGVKRLESKLPTCTVSRLLLPIGSQ